MEWLIDRCVLIICIHSSISHFRELSEKKGGMRMIHAEASRKQKGSFFRVHASANCQDASTTYVAFMVFVLHQDAQEARM